MEIQKIFNELGGEEKLYSILLDQTEMALFSEFQKEFAKTDKILSKKLGKTIKEIRKNRNTDFSMVSGKSVNHRINGKISDYVAADMASSNKLFPQGHMYHEGLTRKKAKKLGKWGQIEYDHGWGSGFGQKNGEERRILNQRILDMKEAMKERWAN